MQSLLETEICDETGKIVQSPLSNLRKKHHHVLTPRQSERNLGLSDPAHSYPHKTSSSRFQIGGLGNFLVRVKNSFNYKIYLEKLICGSLEILLKPLSQGIINFPRSYNT